ncbi:MAG: hypothetical protein GY798_02780 [Hyphomicrobiales bacterium]|nr:hypothetical protein [Hyphomicrobiales bacterium]
MERLARAYPVKRCDATEITIPAAGKVAFGRVGHFGNWLRLEARLSKGAERRLTVTLQMKG